MLKGIYKLPSDNYQVKLTYQGRRYNLGTYAKEEDAAKAIRQFNDVAQGRPDAERDERAKAMQEAARIVHSHTPTPKAKATTMRQDVKSCLERTEQLERQVKMILLNINGR